MKLVVFGLGYLGATHAACMAELGHHVLGIEVDSERRDSLAAGTLPFYEPGLPELLNKHLASGRLEISDSYEQAADWGDTYFLAVGTPQRKGDYAADLTYVDAVIDELVPKLGRDSVILGKSTVPVGTCERLSDRAASLANPAVKVEIAWNPEFLREGHAIDDTLRPDRLVVGLESGGSADAVARQVYADLISSGVPFLTMDTASAEMVKVAANSFLATKISFINAIAEVCEAAGADVQAVAEAIGHDDRIGRKFLNAGLGFGGGCLPKDIRAFMARAGELGSAEALAFLREVDNVNLRRRNRMVDRAREVCGGSLIGKRIAILGAAFKPESDDVRDSPALNVAGQLQLQGAAVAVYDPRAMSNSRKLFPTLEYVESTLEACTNADLVMVLTEWSEFRELDPHVVSNAVRRLRVIDGRLCLDRGKWVAAGWEFSA
ncbi:UDP-glucose dehydrogenase family protein [Gordonia terrae]